MTSDNPPKSKWQFSLWALLVLVTFTAPIAGLFFGGFGEEARVWAVSLLAKSAVYILPISTVAVVALLLMMLVRLSSRTFQSKR